MTNQTTTAQIPLETFTRALHTVFAEAFEQVQGIFLDKGTSLFETLETVSADEASRRISTHCACIAAQVEHVSYYLELIPRFVRGEEVGKVDWNAAWQREGVTPDEWDALLARLHAAHRSLLALVDDPNAWSNEDAIAGAIGTAAHVAYHLGEIRQGLGVLRG